MFENQKDTIVAIGTKPGEAAIGIVRLSGNKAIKIAEKIFRSKNKKKISNMKTYSMIYGYVVDKMGRVIDQVIVSLMRKPKSYTKEDVVEINCHGGVIATEKVLELCLRNGSRIAEPGEFTKRAFLNGRIDLSQAEAVIDLVRAKTEQSLRVAANNLKGGLKEKINLLRKRLLEVIVELEASIDFIEEDIEITPYEELTLKVKEIQKEINALINDEKRGEIIKNGVRVTIVGKPNAGKSSLLNAIAKKEKAIVTHIPGTRGDAVEEILYLEGIPILLIDTAGIRKARNLIEKLGVQKSLSYIDSSDIIIFVIDSSVEIDEKDKEIFKLIKDKNIIVCANKIDLKKITDTKKIKKEFNLDKIIEISAIKGTGLLRIESEIRKIIFGDEDFNIEDKIIINKRHKKILMEVYKLLKNATTAMELKMSEEFPSSDLKICYDLIGEITGEITTDDILNGIFSKFCIGK
ncbi:MAG: tRNA uridine-5-carboxymethylaminomethyl(34) synthesis GTPase MnmE [Actinobacteria bacterium]|nr:tRNA uridine-5-carboxymethylaminomethyl(34) synthesis GTPase MnmE [Actinomycetota bacterium]